MGPELEYIEGQTPIDENESDGLLIKTISTKGELDEFEQLNIQQAVELDAINNFLDGKTVILLVLTMVLLIFKLNKSINEKRMELCPLLHFPYLEKRLFLLFIKELVNYSINKY